MNRRLHYAFWFSISMPVLAAVTMLVLLYKSGATSYGIMYMIAGLVAAAAPAMFYFSAWFSTAKWFQYLCLGGIVVPCTYVLIKLGINTPLPTWMLAIAMAPALAIKLAAFSVPVALGIKLFKRRSGVVAQQVDLENA